MDKIMRIYIPTNINELPLLQRVKYMGLQYIKGGLLRYRAHKEDDAIYHHELSVYTLNGYTEFFRATSKREVIDQITNGVIEVELTGEADIIYVKVGKAMQQWLNRDEIALKIIDIDGNENIMNKVKTYQFHNKEYI